MTRRFPPVASAPRFSKCDSPSPLGSPIVTRDPPSFPRPGGHVRRVLSRTRGYVGLPADEAMGPRRPSRWEGTILWEPYLTSFIYKFMVRNDFQPWPFVRAQCSARERNERVKVADGSYPWPYVIRYSMAQANFFACQFFDYLFGMNS